MNRIITTGLLIYFCQSTNLFGIDRTWVVFENRNDSNERYTALLDSLQLVWPKKSLSRRAKSGLGLTNEDMDINPRYITSIANLGAQVVCISKWMNAVSIVAASSVISEIEMLDFVKTTHSVASFQIEAKSLNDINLEFDKESGVVENKIQSHQMYLGDYGQSYTQAIQSGAIEAHRRGYTGDGVLLGMLDTGFQLDHRAFAGLDLVAQYDFIFNDSDPSYDPRTDKRGQANHGTACLSVIVGQDPGRLVGIAPGVSVALAKTELTGSEERIEEDYWVEAIEWLEWLGVDVVSSSLSYRKWYSKGDYNGKTPFITRAAERASELGVIICNSAGNDGPLGITLGAPADAPNVLAIAAVDSTGLIAGFSSRGPTSDGRIKPDVAALGKNVVCAKPMTWNEYTRWNGTSLSCPIVAGIVALVIEAHPDWSPSRVREAIRNSSDKSISPNLVYGYGIVNARKAIDYPSLTGRVMNRSTGLGIAGLDVIVSSGTFQLSTITEERGFFEFVNVENNNLITMQIFKGISEIHTSKFQNIPPSDYRDILVDLISNEK